MGFFASLFAVDAAPVPQSRRVTASVTSLIPGGVIEGQPWQYASPVSRSDAEAVPACARAVDLVASTVAGLPVQRFTTAGNPAPLGWLTQPEAARPRTATFNDLVRDLIFDGRAWLLTGPARACTYVPTTYVSGSAISTATPWGIPLVEWRINGYPAPANLAQFHGWHDGIVNHGARILRTALALQGAAKERADSPLPQTTLKNTSGYELSDLEVDELLAAYKKARATNATAYINAGVDEAHNGWSSVELQMVEAQNFYNAQCANLVGVGASLIAAANTGGSSLNYSNVTQEMQQLVNLGAVNAAIKALEATLTQIDPDGYTVRINVGGLLRGNPAEVAEIVAQLLPIGVITLEEARTWVDLAAQGGI